MSEPAPRRELAEAAAALRPEPPSGPAARTRHGQLEYEALLANASIGIAFTRERCFFLTNPKFAEMFGYGPDELVGQPGEVVYPSRESYAALGAIAVPTLSAGRQLDVEWQMRRKDGSTLLCRLIAKAIDAANTQSGTVWIVEDITERRRQADELARLLREQDAILGTASIGIVFVKDRRIVRCNRRYEEMYGYGPGEMNGQPTTILYPGGAGYEQGGEVYESLARGETSRRVELRRRKDGSTFWNRADGRAVDPREPHKGSVWIVEDITEERKAEEELQRVLAEQQALLNNVEMFGYAPGSAVGAPTRDVYFTEAEYEQVTETYAELDRGQMHARETWVRRQDGSGFWCRVTGRAVAPGEPAKGYVWLCEDITERKRADEALHRLLREQDAVLENALAGIIFVKERRIVRCNRRFEEIFGYAPGELLNQPTRFMFRSDAEYDAGGAPVYEAVWRGETQQLRRQHMRKDGSLIWCSISGRALQAGDPSLGSVWLFEDITRQHEAEERIERALAEQELILDNATVGIAFVRNRSIQRCNRYLEEMVGAGPGELVGQSSEILFADRDDWQRAGALAYVTTAPGGTHDAEWRFKRRDGTAFRCRTRGRRIDAGDEAQEWIWSFEDVTAERDADQRVQRALAEQELILDNATVGISFVRDRTYQRCNPRFEQMFGYGPGELIGQGTRAIYGSADEYERDADWYEEMRAGRSVTAEREYRRKDGSRFWCKLVGKAIDPANPRAGSIWIYDDVTAEHDARESLEASRDALERAVAERTTELQEAKAHAQHLADHDALTGLPNRRLLEDRLRQALALSQRNRKQTAVMFIDLDRFKPINDSLGHAVGDVLLKEVSHRLVNQLREGDTICRIGGDEFVVVLPEVRRASDAAQVAQKVIEQVSLPVLVDERELAVTCSVGIAVFPDDGRDAETLIRNADAAMYHAKELGRANYQFFTEQMNQAASRRLALETDLRRALGRDELRVHYQRIVDAHTGRVTGHEALVRWQHPERGLVPPVEFIQIAEESGLILKIGEWVLREACRWATFIGVERGLQISVNLSPRQFNDPKLAQHVAQALKETGLPPRLLELEITETLAMQHTDITLSTLKRLKKLGVSIAIDDFGTGYSSLAYLRRFPVDKVKIDRMFVADAPEDREQGAIISAIVALAHALDIEVIGEGVENEAQQEFLRRCGCDYIQGYLIGQPADADTAAKDYL
ncbi:MAG: PAS domain S-box protein [Betaproteobacteria bacterium]|nr:MAG: PAS domain S-box protein [Betaproteobacteria bacterium]